MDETLPTETEARNWAPFFVRPRGSGSSLHLPTPEATRKDPKPLCEAVLDTGRSDWTSKPLDVYPHGFAPICKLCLRELSRRRRATGDVD